MSIPNCPKGIKFDKEHPMIDACLHCESFPCEVFVSTEEDKCDGACAINFD